MEFGSTYIVATTALLFSIIGKIVTMLPRPFTMFGNAQMRAFILSSFLGSKVLVPDLVRISSVIICKFNAPETRARSRNIRISLGGVDVCIKASKMCGVDIISTKIENKKRA